MKKSTKHLFSTLLYFLSLTIALVLLYWMLSMPHAKAAKGEFILFVTMQNGPVEETLFAGSYPTNQACLAYAYHNYPIDGKGWIAYKCIHEDLLEYLESKKEIRL